MLTQGKEIDVLSQQNIMTMLGNLSAQQLTEFMENTPNPTLLHL